MIVCKVKKKDLPKLCQNRDLDGGINKTVLECHFETQHGIKHHQLFLGIERYMYILL